MNYSYIGLSRHEVYVHGPMRDLCWPRPVLYHLPGSSAASSVSRCVHWRRDIAAFVSLTLSLAPRLRQQQCSCCWQQIQAVVVVHSHSQKSFFLNSLVYFLHTRYKKDLTFKLRFCLALPAAQPRCPARCLAFPAFVARLFISPWHWHLIWHFKSSMRTASDDLLRQKIGWDATQNDLRRTITHVIW